MLKLSKKVEYALMALLHLDGLKADELAVSREIAEHFKIPSELLGKVLQSLTRAGVIESVHGAKGGYRLAGPLDQITLGSVEEAVEGKMQLVPCQGSSCACDQYVDCNIRDPILHIQQQLTNYLNGISLSAFRSEPDEDRLRKVNV